MQKLNENLIPIPDIQIPIRIATLKTTGFPSVLSLWYLVIDNKIHCATQKDAKIVSYLKKILYVDLKLQILNNKYKY